MKLQLNILKGIHPGFVLQRELDKRRMRKKDLATDIHEHAQTLTAITKGKRGMNTPLSLKIEQALGLEEGFFMLLQVYYEIEQEKNKRNNAIPDLSILRPVLFWDTGVDKINWHKQQRAIIQRVFERGNEAEKQEIIHFYGQQAVNAVMNKHNHAPL